MNKLALEGYIRCKCPECDYIMIVEGNVGDVVTCDLCADEGFDVRMNVRVASVYDDKPEGEDARLTNLELRKEVEKFYNWLHDSPIGRFISDKFEARKFAFSPLQYQVFKWCIRCFGPEVTSNKQERLHRFFEEATELCQALGMKRTDAYLLVDYVFDREKGEPSQEVGGVGVTLAALCTAHEIPMSEAFDAELRRINGKMEQIRMKQATKPEGALPEAPDVECPECMGTGWVGGQGGDTCGTCNGVGKVKPVKQADNGPPSLKWAFMAGWYVNAADPNDYPGLSPDEAATYLESCMVADWNEYWRKLSA